jgi:H+/Cl- antiporter ClcA
VTPAQRLRRIRILLGGFIFGVVVSGVTAFPLTWEVNLLVKWFGQGEGGLATWLRTVQAGLQNNDQNYPFIAYGTDWLAFGHLAIAAEDRRVHREPVAHHPLAVR